MALPGFPRVEDTYDELVAVASADICGMRNLILKGDECESAAKAMQAIWAHAANATVYADEEGTKPSGHTHEEEMFFGDSLYMLGCRDRPIEEQLNLLSVRVAVIIGRCMFDDMNGWLLRAGIGVGDLRRSTLVNPYLGNAQQRFWAGTSAVAAVKLQESQDWFGGAAVIPDSLEIDTKMLVEYPVPLKKDNPQKSTQVLAIDWVEFLKQQQWTEERICSRVEQIVDATGSNRSEVRQKIENTFSFVRSRFQTHAD